MYAELYDVGGCLKVMYVQSDTLTSTILVKKKHNTKCVASYINNIIYMAQDIYHYLNASSAMI